MSPEPAGWPPWVARAARRGSSRSSVAENVDCTCRDDDDGRERDRAFQHHQQLGADVSGMTLVVLNAVAVE